MLFDDQYAVFPVDIAANASDGCSSKTYIFQLTIQLECHLIGVGNSEGEESLDGEIKFNVWIWTRTPGDFQCR